MSKIDRCIEWISGAVTIDAVLNSRNMTERFTGGYVTVMTGFAVIGDTGMAERHVEEIKRTVMTVGAVLSVRSSRYMVSQFADTDRIVMAGITAIDHTGVIISAGGESSRCMTVGTVLIKVGTRVVRIRRHMIE